MSRLTKLTTKLTIWFLIRILRNRTVRAAILDWIRLDISKSITNRLGLVVKFGLFKNLHLDETSGWDESGSTLQKILGMYEQEILNAIGDLGKFDTVINIGAADGYYGFGFLQANLCKTVVFFEKNQESRNRIITKGEKLGTKIQVYGEASKETLTQVFKGQNFGKTLVIMDIEGAENELLDYPMIHNFKEATIIVEIHDFLAPTFNKDELEQRLGAHFEIHKIYNRTRCLPDVEPLNTLHDNERWLLVSEGRVRDMEWWVLSPHVL